ncbi:flavin reductase family protein [uncultured Amnibacterium sp.]|uniref:flavin reductase family protein n=1 Tax=uncultured Amnibacterium sp. TaxID=1631851 RepID=UPI0035CAAEC7
MADVFKSDWWRAVLGEYPTGVTLISADDAAGDPVGMIVGSFTAVSQNPPLIGFFPDATSTTFPLVSAAGRFSASVLGASHEAFCRAFVAKAPDRFDRADFIHSENGMRRLRDAVAWFDAEIESQRTYGDHDFVVARVTDFGVGDADAGLPLLFRRGGYGAFAVPSDEFDAESLARQLRIADAASDIVGGLAEATGTDVVVSTLVRDSVVVVGVARPRDTVGDAGARRIGSAFPFAAPIAPLFVAWASPMRQTAWIEGSRHLLGAVDRPGLAALLAAVRRRGYGLSGDQVLADRFEGVMQDAGPRRASFARLWADMAQQTAVTSATELLEPAQVSAVQVPVFGPDGSVELVVSSSGLAGLSDRSAVQAAIRRALAAAAAMTERIGGRAPVAEAEQPA